MTPTRGSLRRAVISLLLAGLGVSLSVVTSGAASAERLGPGQVGGGTSSSPGGSHSPGEPVTSGTAAVTGSGFGHGVGMSQYGAFGMARAGASASEILTHYYTGVSVGSVTDGVDVRVNVVHRGRTVTLAPVGVAGSTGHQLRLTTREGATATLVPGDRAVITPTGSGVSVVITRGTGSSGSVATLTTTGLGVDWTGTRAMVGPATRVTLSAGISGSLSTKTRSYRWGRLWLSNLSSLIEAVATLDLHSEYLRGVDEMPSSWPAAALQAQAIVARSYALVGAGASTRSSCGGCQLWDDQRSQMYTGWAKESERIGSVDYGARWVAAVSATQAGATSGTAVLYQGAPISAVYSSSTGGRTRDSQAVWGGARPYLTGVADPWSLDRTINPTFAAWSRTVSVPGLLALFGLPDLVSVAVTARDGAGAATQVTATSSSGRQVSVGAETFRSRFGLPSSWVGAIAVNR